MNSEHQLLSGTSVRDFFSEDEENQFQTFYNGTSALAIGTAFLKVLSGEASEDNPVSFIAEADKNTSRIVTAKSIFGDKYTVGATTRALTLVDADDASTSYANGNWVTLDNLTADGKFLHQLLADETLQKRHNPLEIRKGKHAYTAQTPPPLSDERGFYDIDKIAMAQFQRPIKFAYTNGTTLTFEFLNLLVAKDRTAYVISRCKTSRDLTSITNWDTTDDVRGPQTTSGGNGNPGGTGPGPISGFQVGVATGSNSQGDIAGLRRSQAGTTSDVTAIEDKTRFITASGTGITNITGDGTCLRASNILENTNQKFVTQSEKDAIASNTLQALNNANDISTNAGNITTNATDITTNATDIATNTTDIATNATDITSLQTDMTAVENALDESNNGSSARTGQAGVEVATFSASGVLSSISDGTAGQFLKTNGAGVLSFASASTGWHGSSTLIKIFPTEFKGNDVGRAIVQTRIEDDTANTLGVACNNASGALFAFNEIPSGFKATHVQVYTETTVTNGVEVYSFNQTSGAITSVGTGNTNASIDITDVTSGATASIVIEVSPGSTDEMVFGADITIAST